mgnify:CR=1 FL=1
MIIMTTNEKINIDKFCEDDLNISRVALGAFGHNTGSDLWLFLLCVFFIFLFYYGQVLRAIMIFYNLIMAWFLQQQRKLMHFYALFYGQYTCDEILRSKANEPMKKHKNKTSTYTSSSFCCFSIVCLSFRVCCLQPTAAADAAVVAVAVGILDQSWFIINLQSMTLAITCCAFCLIFGPLIGIELLAQNCLPRNPQKKL